MAEDDIIEVGDWRTRRIGWEAGEAGKVQSIISPKGAVEACNAFPAVW